MKMEKVLSSIRHGGCEMVEGKEIGFHCNTNIGTYQEAYNKGVRTIQIMLGSPRTYNTKALDPEIKGRFIDQGMEVICHGPYVTSLL